MMKIAVRSFALQVVCIGMSWSTLSAATYEKYSWEDGYFLDRSISDDGTQAVHWSHDIDLHSGQRVRAGGGYMKGYKIRLGDLCSVVE
jgi:hypothetical protein